MHLEYNGSQLKKPNIFGTLNTLRIQYYYTQTQCGGGARDVRVLLLTPVIIPFPATIKCFELRCQFYCLHEFEALKAA